MRVRVRVRVRVGRSLGAAGIPVVLFGGGAVLDAFQWEELKEVKCFTKGGFRWPLRGKRDERGTLGGREAGAEKREARAWVPGGGA